jgi:hypothetical protein
MKPENELDPRLKRKLAVLNKVTDRNPENANSGRAKFMQQAQELAPGVSPVENRRHNGWKQSILPMFMNSRKEHTPMFSTLATILVIVSLVLGGGGVTVVSAQSSQPDQPLYNVKIWSEDVRLILASDPLSQYQLSLEFANRRAEEIQSMLQAGSVPPDAVQIRYQNQLEQAIRFATNLPDAQAIQALEQIQTRLLTQQQALLQVQAYGSSNAEAVLLQIRLMVQDRLQWVKNGLKNPTQLRDQLQQRDQDRLHTTTQTAQGTQLAPGTGGGNPWTTGTPTPGSGYGPGNGTGDCITCTPTFNDLGGNNPWTTGTPTPNSGYGPGSQSTQQQGQPTTSGFQSTTIPGGMH